MSDKKIETKSKDIAYFNSRNLAVEMIEKGVKDLSEVILLSGKLYNEWVKFHNETEARSELKKCPQCTSPLKVVPAGVSKKNGNRYEAFYACDSCGYKKSVVEKKVDNETNLPAEERVVETPMPPKQ